jgi:hypothetical protein
MQAGMPPVHLAAYRCVLRCLSTRLASRTGSGGEAHAKKTVLPLDYDVPFLFQSPDSAAAHSSLRDPLAFASAFGGA